jgi:hypothetical protein
MKAEHLDIHTANERLAMIDRKRLEELLSPENLLKLGYTIAELG